MLPEPAKARGKSLILAAAILAALIPGSLRAAAQPSRKNAVQGEGCVRAGVESRCLVLRDIKTGHLYELIFKSEPPAVGLGIEFTGLLHPGPSACMQGTPVEVTSWAHKASIKCLPGQAGKRDRTGAR